MCKKLVTLLLPLFLLLPLTGCLDEVADVLDEVEDFIDDLDVDHHLGGLTIVIGGDYDDDYDDDDCYWWCDW